MDNNEKVLIKQPFMIAKGLIIFFAIMIVVAFFEIIAFSSLEGLEWIIGLCVASILILPWIIYLLCQNKYVEIVVTDKRVYITNTKTNKFRNELPFEKISNITKSGTNSFQISTATGVISVLCENRDQVFEVISEQLRNSQTRHVIIEKDLTKEPQKENKSETDKIREYKKLLDDGIISQEEFDAKKKELLGL